MTTIIYRVTDRIADEPNAHRLIEAESKSQLLAHLAQDFEITVATTQDMKALAVDRGIRIEVAKTRSRGEATPPADPAT